ncbi:diguanylate cyclase [Ectothiorhodospiraceae bacterium BW-2]|nr:diguanylate cyclase [Ectothiorhodospiraceae bacterium BW-2]
MNENSRKPRILLVDDEPISLTTVATFLKYSYQTLVAKSGAEALIIASREPYPDIILLDVEMPGMDGFEICRKLKFNPDTRDIAVIFVTSRESDEDERAGLELGAVDFITKPVKPDILRVRINTQMKLQQQRQQLQESEELLKATLDSTRDAIALWHQGESTPCLTNDNFQQLWQRDSGKLSPLTLADISTRFKEGEQWLQEMEQLLLQDSIDERVICCCEESRYINQYSRPMRRGSRITGRVFSFSDVTEQVLLENSLRQMSTTDALTGLRNRRDMLTILEREVAWARRNLADLGVMQLDIDHFKQVNDTYGHTLGDEVLRTVAEIIKTTIRSDDYAFRTGGEEFLIFVPAIERCSLLEMAERLRMGVENGSYAIESGCTISIGLVLLSQLEPENKEDRLLVMADAQLYRAKAKGRNRICISESG